MFSLCAIAIGNISSERCKENEVKKAIELPINAENCDKPALVIQNSKSKSKSSLIYIFPFAFFSSIAIINRNPSKELEMLEQRPVN